MTKYPRIPALVGHDPRMKSGHTLLIMPDSVSSSHGNYSKVFSYFPARLLISVESHCLESETLEGNAIKSRLLDTKAAVEEAVEVLRKYRCLAVDLEGVNLGRNGTISIIQIATETDEVFLFDITKLQRSAFTAGLKGLLEDRNIVKVFYDLRSDCAALDSLFQVHPYPIVDCQIAVMQMPKNRRRRYLISLKTAIQSSTGISEEERCRVEAAKDSGKLLFAEEWGGRKEIWDERPLPEALFVYLSSDVRYLRRLLSEAMRESHISDADLRAMSQLRAGRALISTTVGGAEKDF